MGSGDSPLRKRARRAQLPQAHFGPVEEAGEHQELAGEHPQPQDDDDVAGTRRWQKYETRDYENEPADEVEGPAVLGRLALLGAATAAVVAGLEAVTRL
jgi:hypothetical protein